MELNFKFDKKMVVETANRVLDGYEYKGKTIREWADLIANPKTNADRIRSMSDDKMASWLALHPCLPNCPAQTDECFKSSKFENCKKQWLDWLKREVKEK